MEKIVEIFTSFYKGHVLCVGIAKGNEAPMSIKHHVHHARLLRLRPSHNRKVVDH